jgi:membrane associated rhomboid family serine protease/tetratricopeptide (TPR) repeat protein
MSIVTPPTPVESEHKGSGRRSIYFLRGPRIRRGEFPIATTTLLVINVIVFLLTLFAGGLNSGEGLLDFGASYGPYVRAGEYWRLVTAMFLHGGFGHLALNMFGLYVLGELLERVYGYGRFMVIYVGAGIGGGCLSVLGTSDIAVGASGAILGIAGAMVATGFLHSESVPPRWKRVFGLRLLPFVAADVALGLFVNFAPSSLYRALGVSVVRIDNWAHLGGLFAGMVLAGLIPPPRSEPANRFSLEAERPKRRPQWIVILPAAVVLFAFGAAARYYPRARAVTRLLARSARLRTAPRADEALKLLQEAERLNPRDERTHEQLGLFYLAQNRLPEAIAEYERLLATNQASLDAKLGLAQAYKLRGDDEKAKQYLKGIAKDFPDEAEAQYALGALYAEHKMYTDAIARFQEALRLKPDLAGAHNDLAWLYATSEDLRVRDPEKALEHARQAVLLDRWKQPAFIDTLAEALYANKEYGEAVRVQTKALALDPNNAEYRDHMARYRRAAGV